MIENNLVAIVSTYKSNDSTIQNIRNIALQVPRVVVVDDSGNTANNSFLTAHLSETTNISIICNAENKGLARSLNHCIEQINTSECEWVIIFDDDTILADQAISRLTNAVNNQTRSATFKTASLYALSRAGHYNPEFAEDVLTEKKVVITSGCMFSLKLFHSLSGFAPDYFIDLLDFDFCLRAKAKGGAIFQLNSIDIKHTVGSPETINLGIAKVTTSNHAPFRYYYHYRNAVFFTRKHFIPEPLFVLKLQLGLLLKTVKMICFEKNKCMKTKYLCIGIMHGLINRQGRIPEKLMHS